LVGPQGKELPPGRGTAREGASIYAQKCAACHGATGTEGPADRLVGGQGTLAGDRPVRTVGSYWPYATTVWDYINRAMPVNNPGSLTPNEVYALTAFILSRNGIVQETEVMDRESLPKVRMPNRDGFVPDARPDWKSAAR
jgi:cytochrome c